MEIDCCFVTSGIHADQFPADASRAEREATASLMSGPFPRCVPAEVGAFRLSPLMVRYLLAEALLRLPPATQTAGQR